LQHLKHFKTLNAAAVVSVSKQCLCCDAPRSTCSRHLDSWSFRGIFVQHPERFIKQFKIHSMVVLAENEIPAGKGMTDANLFAFPRHSFIQQIIYRL
jgi:hypothetical protein